MSRLICKKKIIVTVAAVILTLILIVSGMNGDGVKSLNIFGKTLYVGGSGSGNYTRIQDAIDNASDGDTVFVYNGIYYENVIVDKSINLIGEDRNKTIIDGYGTGDVVYISKNRVNINNFILRNSGNRGCPDYDAGIEIHSNHDSLANCKILDSHYGIIFLNSSNNNIANCEISNNSKGVYLEFCTGNNIADCEIWNNAHGIYFEYSPSNRIENCEILNNSQGILFKWGCNENEIVNCKICNNDGDGIDIFFSCDANEIVNCKICNNDGDGIEFYDTSDNNRVMRCEILDNAARAVYSHWIFSTNQINYNDICGNADGVYSEQGIAYATHNWWGSLDGPSGFGFGNGDSVNGNVAYDPWLREPIGPNVSPTIDITYPKDNQIMGETIVISGTASDQNGDETLREVEVKIDDGKWRIANGTISWVYEWNTTIVEDGQHTIYARSYDWENYSNLVSRNVTIDNSPPFVVVRYPNGGECLKGTIMARWDAIDNIDGDLDIEIKYSNDSGLFWHEIASGEENDGEYEWDTTMLPDGKNYLIMINATDDACNTRSDESDDVFTIDSTVPSIDIEAPREGYLYIMNREIMPTPRRNTIIIGKIKIETSVEAKLGIDRVEFYVDGVLKETVEEDPYSWLWDYLSIGTHVIKVLAYDNAGNTAMDEMTVKILNI